MIRKKCSKKAVSSLLCLVMLLTGLCGMSVSAAPDAYTIDTTSDEGYYYPTNLTLKHNGMVVSSGTILHGKDTITISNILIASNPMSPEANRKKIYLSVDGQQALSLTADASTATITLPDNATGYYYGHSSFAATKGILIFISTVPADHSHSYSWQTVSEPSATQDGEEIYVCECGDIADRRVKTAMSFCFDNCIKKIQDAKSGEIITLEVGLWNSFPQKLMQEISNRRDIDIVIHFTYKGKNYEIKIPKDTAIDTTLEWYGPEKLTQMFGRTEIVK